MGRTIVIGDIHGCFDELTDLIRLVELRADDRVIAVGDLIVKGEKNREVLDLFIDDERFSSVVGNHDRALRQRWRGEPIRLTKAQQKASFELEPNRERYANYLKTLPFMIDLDSHLVVHAGVRPGVRLKHQMASDLTEMRTMGESCQAQRGSLVRRLSGQKNCSIRPLAGQRTASRGPRDWFGHRLRLRGQTNGFHPGIEPTSERPRAPIL